VKRRLTTAFGMLLLAGCTTTAPQPLNVQLAFVNDSGQPVTVEVLGRTDQGFRSTSLKGVPMPKRALVLQLISDRCTYLYGVPVEHLPNPASGNAYTTLQVETDLSLYATRSLTTVPVSDLIASQPVGFPLTPIAHACPEV
jgi:hypothetical protein